MGTQKSYSRRKFLADSGKAAALAVTLPNLLSSCHRKERVNLGFIGMGGRAHSLLKHFILIKQVQVTAITDPFRERMEERARWVNDVYAKRMEKGKVKYDKCLTYDTFEELLANKKIDAVVIATPDHWHVPLSVASIRAGKDVYVEKPLGLTIDQGITLRKLVHKKNAIVQYGTQQRSDKNFWLAVELTLRKKIGNLEQIDAWCLGQNSDYVTSKAPEPVPPGFNYDLWLGPAKIAPYNHYRVSREGAWHIYDYAIGFIAGWGAHPLDIAQWGNQADNTSPVEYSGTGTFFPKDSLFDTINSWDLHCKYANGVKLHFFSYDRMPDYDASYLKNFTNHGTTFWGSDGWVSVDRSRIEVSNPEWLKLDVPPGEELAYRSTHHQQNFIDCVLSRKQPVSTIDAAVRSDTISHLGDILIRTKADVLKWDPVHEDIVNPSTEMMRLQQRPQRKPYDIIQ